MAKAAKGNGSISSIGRIQKEEDYRHRVSQIRHALFYVLAFSFAIFVIIAGLAILNEGVSAFVKTVESINIGYYLLALLILFIGYAVRFPKWEIYLHRLGIKVKRGRSFLVYLSMYSMDITPGRWGRAVVGVTLNRLTGAHFGRTFPAIVADIFTDFLGFVILAVMALLLIRMYVLPSLIAAVLLLLPFVFMYHRKPFELIKGKLSRFAFLKKFFEVGDLYFKYNRKLGGDVYLYSLGYTIPAMFLNSLSFYFIILAFGIHVSIAYFPLVVFIFTSSTLFGMITGVPGTLGVTDAILLGDLVAFLGPLGVTFGIASVITIFARIANIWFVQLFGSGALFYTFRYWKK